MKAIFFDVGNTLIGEARPMAAVLAETLAAIAAGDGDSALDGGADQRPAGGSAGPAPAPSDMGSSTASSGLSSPAGGARAGAAPVVETSIEAAIARVNAEFWHDARWTREHWDDPERIYAMWVGYYARIFGDLGRPDVDARLAAAMIGYYQTAPAWQPFPETRDVLAAVRERGLRVGAISDWGSALTRILAGHGLLDFFDFVLISANIGISKPHTSLYQLALARAGVRPEEALMVGDSYHSDILGARSAGIPGVLIDRRRALPPLDCPVIHDLGELLHSLA